MKEKTKTLDLPENKVCDICGSNKVDISPIKIRYDNPYKYRATCHFCGSSINGTTFENTYEWYIENCTKEKVNEK